MERIEVDIKSIGVYLLSPQEHAFISSTTGSPYAEKFYTPIIIQEGFDIKSINHIRQRVRTFLTSPVYWIDSDGKIPKDIVEALLSPLDEDGATLHDPKSLDERLITSHSSKKFLKIRE